MSVDRPEDRLALFNRDELVRKWLQDYTFRNPSASTERGTEPYVLAHTQADYVAPVYYDARIVADSTNVDLATGEQLRKLVFYDIGEKLPATGGSGYVRIVADYSVPISDVKELTTEDGQMTFRCRVSSTYGDDSLVPITGVDTGIETNLPAGTVLRWTAPPLGLDPRCTVEEDNDGEGLTGGREEESDDEYRERYKTHKANPPAAGNTAEYVKETRKAPIGIQQVFTYPAIKGSGTIGVAFTLRPATLGSDRIPNNAQLAEVEARLKGAMPGDDGILVISLLEQPTTLAFTIDFNRKAVGYEDDETWPPWIEGDPVLVASHTSPRQFRLSTGTDTDAPQVGQAIALYNKTARRMVRKEITDVETFTPNRAWDIVTSPDHPGSDTAYEPMTDQLVSPWSDSFNLIVPAVLSYADGIGPGEMVSVFVDPGLRKRRQPESPAAWPSTITRRILDAVFDVGSAGVPVVQDADLLLPELPYATTVGVPGLIAYLITVDDIAFYAP